jgi:hypothetical protein
MSNQGAPEVHLLDTRGDVTLCNTRARPEDPRTRHLDEVTCPGCMAALGFNLQERVEQNGMEMLFGIGVKGALPKLRDNDECDCTRTVHRLSDDVGHLQSKLEKKGKTADRLTEIVRELIENAEEMLPYIPDCHVKKWRLDAPTEKAKLVLKILDLEARGAKGVKP